MKKKTKNQFQKTACEQKTTSEKTKFGSNKKLGLEWTMDGLGTPFRKKYPIQKSKKTVKIKVKLPHLNKKQLARKQIFVQTPFSHSTLELEQKKLHRKTTRLFAPFPVSAWQKSLLQFDFRNHENVWTDLKKQTAPDYNSNSLNRKKNRSAIIVGWEDEGG